tara:strand:- start:1651 stop:2949 length:1299 start_codon:yes stop_codon:yes gene_type:complete
MAWYNNVLGSGANVFGAESNINTDKYEKLGLLDPKDLKKAQRASLTKGLLGSALGYLAQPKNQNYGSIIPYIAKGLGAGVKMAQEPFNNLTNKVEENQAIKNYEEALRVKNAEKEFVQGWGKDNDTYMTTERVSKGVNSNYKPMQQNLMLSPYTNGDTLEQGAPNLGNDALVYEDAEKELDYFNKNKHLETALRNGAIKFPDYLKYTADPEGYELTDGAMKFDGNNRLVAHNRKDFAQEKAGAPVRSDKQKQIEKLSVAGAMETLNTMDRDYADYQMLGATKQKLEDEGFEYFEGIFSDAKSKIMASARSLGLWDVVKQIESGNTDWLGNTEMLNADMRAGVFRAINDLGIGARGIDTPAERNFLIQVLTGDASSQRSTLTYLVNKRYDMIEKHVRRFNDAEKNDTFFDDYVGKTSSYRRKGQYPVIEISDQ